MYEELKHIGAQVDALEETHNEVLDTAEAINREINLFHEEIHIHVQELHEAIQQLRTDMRIRIEHAKKATNILSLLAQKDELAPIAARIEKQPYEFYARSEWFKKQLSQ